MVYPDDLMKIVHEFYPNIEFVLYTPHKDWQRYSHAYEGKYEDFIEVNKGIFSIYCVCIPMHDDYIWQYHRVAKVNGRINAYFNKDKTKFFIQLGN